MTTNLKSITIIFIILICFKVYLIYELTKIRLEYLTSISAISEDFSISNLFLERQEKSSYLLLLLYPLFLGIKLLGITCILDTGFTLLNKSTSFLKLLFAVIIAEYVYLLPDLIRVLWQSDWLSNPYLSYINFSPAILFDYTSYPFFVKYLLSSFNYFEGLYILFLSYLIAELSISKFSRICLYVLKTYGIFLLCWSLCVGLFIENLL